MGNDTDVDIVALEEHSIINNIFVSKQKKNIRIETNPVCLLLVL